MRCHVITLFVFKIGGTWHNYTMAKREKREERERERLIGKAILFRAFARCPIFVVRSEMNIDRSSIGVILVFHVRRFIVLISFFFSFIVYF